jgi:hypothetical protein
VPFTQDSGGYTLADKLERLGFEFTHSEIDQILDIARARMTREGRLLKNDDLATIAEEVASGRV